MQRLDVVPWSMAATYFSALSVMAVPKSLVGSRDRVAGWVAGRGAARKARVGPGGPCAGQKAAL
ncbi:hypothetical protein GCM10010503_30530 [Streptomyces lucensis JCM 4490]|uniref:Uncharacterized protein n=1 Tax=Streptomyces lucensis JCM 4490 TaxID=1306176 RepID=A0A918J650_9ACTN|nr:hypothetical protein GCM10010503_30530 [Streptomyces lucensis JCM 4490]